MTPFSLNIKGRVVEYDHPAIMSIINATPDSFFAGSRAMCAAGIQERAEEALEQGADMIDLGGCSTRPGSQAPDESEELRRLEMALEAIRRVSSRVVVSVDTYRAEVARRCVCDLGADIINDISGGTLDPAMFEVVAQTRAPYVMTHTRGTAATMPTLTDYDSEGGVTAAVLKFFADRVGQLSDMGVADIILDPGFGFAKTVAQNWELMADMEALQVFNRPILAGISRKSMLTKPLAITANEALPATAAANLLALQHGASILRVHDTAAARQVIKIYEQAL